MFVEVLELGERLSLERSVGVGDRDAIGVDDRRVEMVFVSGWMVTATRESSAARVVPDRDVRVDRRRPRGRRRRRDGRWRLQQSVRATRVSSQAHAAPARELHHAQDDDDHTDDRRDAEDLFGL